MDQHVQMEVKLIANNMLNAKMKFVIIQNTVTHVVYVNQINIFIINQYAVMNDNILKMGLVLLITKQMRSILIIQYWIIVCTSQRI